MVFTVRRWGGSKDGGGGGCGGGCGVGVCWGGVERLDLNWVRQKKVSRVGVKHPHFELNFVKTEN